MEAERRMNPAVTERKNYPGSYKIVVGAKDLQRLINHVAGESSDNPELRDSLFYALAPFDAR